MNKEKLKVAAKLCLHLILQVIFSRINLFGFLSPVGLAFAFNKLYLGSNIFAVTGFYFISRVFLFSEIKWVLVTAYEVVFLALYYFANEFIKTNKKLLLSQLFLILSNVLLLYFSFESTKNIVYFFINLCLEIILIFYFYKFDLTYKNKLVFYKFSKNDYFVFSVMVLLLSLGVFAYDFMFEKFGMFMIVAYIIFAARILPIDRFFISIIILALGSVISSGDYFLFKIAIILATFVALIKEYNKWFYISMFTLIVAMLMVIFKIFDIFSIFLIIFAIFLFVFIPNKFMQTVASSFEVSAASIILRKSEEQKIAGLKGRLLLMSDTLKTMQNNFKFLLIGKINRDKACTELAGDVISKCCKNCENYRFCFMENINKRSMFENMLIKAIENKQISNQDLSNGIQAYCNKSSIVVNEVNQIARMFLSYEAAMKQEDTSKLMIASEIGNFADIFKNFAKTIKNSAKINEKLSKCVKEALINALIDAKEVMIFENENGIERVDLIMSNEQVLKRELADTISKVIKNNVQIKELKHLEQSGFSLVSFIPKSKINIQFSVAAKAKEQKNGDSSVITKLSDDRYFVAIADGMGHGEQANRMSSMILNLIKSMFEVGLDSELILESVNKLLIPAGLDNFTTLDSCVIDISKHECIFIKLGSSVSVLKHRDTSEIIASDSLPIGIVESIKPTVVKKQIFQGDMIFLSSDGVVDSFSSVQSFGTFINDAKIYNMQKFLDNVIFDAENLNQKHLDDMTIIGINLLKN